MRRLLFVEHWTTTLILLAIALFVPQVLQAAPGKGNDNGSSPYYFPFAYQYRSYYLSKIVKNQVDELKFYPQTVHEGENSLRNSLHLDKTIKTKTAPTSLEADLPAVQPVNEIVLTGQNIGPETVRGAKIYEIFVKENDAWSSIGRISAQPRSDGKLFLDLSRVYMTTAVKIVLLKPGVDNPQAYDFQFSGLELGYGPFDEANGLTCWIPGISSSLPTQQETLQTEQVSNTIGVTSQLGGIGTNFVLEHGGRSIDILAQGSVGGAGWSTTFYSQAEDGPAVSFNQGAGNQRQMWGYGVQLQALKQVGWTPLYSDHVQPHGNYLGKSVGTTPCDPMTNPIINDDGQLDISGSIESRANNSRIIHWVNTYRYRARREENFARIEADQALYLDRMTAKNNLMRVYLQAPKEKWSVVVNPVEVEEFRKFAPGGCTATNCGGCGNDGCAAHTASLDYAALIYHIGDTDVGIVMHRTDNAPMQAQLNLKTARACSLTDFHCGNLNFHIWLDPDAFHPPPSHFAAGEIRTYSVSYDIGTVADLQRAGYLRQFH